MRFGRGKLERLAGSLAVGLSALLYAPKLAADMIIKTVPHQNMWVADGQTEYGVDVVLDGTEEPNAEVTYLEWANAIPDEINHSASSLPDNVNNPSQNEDDVFYDILMECEPGCIFNRVDNEPGVGGPEGHSLILSGNARETADSNSGPSDIDNNVLGTFYFTVPEETQGNYSLLTAGVTVLDSNNNVYRTSNGNLTIINEPFSVTTPDLYNYNLFFSCRSPDGPNTPFPMGPGYCENFDYDGDDDVDFHDFGEFQILRQGVSE